MPVTNSTRDRLLDAARYLFWERGYSATGLNDILTRAEARSGSFYHFFASKDDLLNAVLDSYLGALHPMVVQPATAGVRDPIRRIFAILAGYREKLVATQFTYGCPIGRLALEIDPRNVTARRLIAENFAAWTGVIEQFLQEARDRLPGGTDFKALAQFILTVMEGGVMQARAHGSIEPFDASVRQLESYLHLLLNQRSSGRPRAARRGNRFPNGTQRSDRRR